MMEDVQMMGSVVIMIIYYKKKKIIATITRGDGRKVKAMVEEK